MLRKFLDILSLNLVSTPWDEIKVWHFLWICYVFFIPHITISLEITQVCTNYILAFLGLNISTQIQFTPSFTDDLMTHLLGTGYLIYAIIVVTAVVYTLWRLFMYLVVKSGGHRKTWSERTGDFFQGVMLGATLWMIPLGLLTGRAFTAIGTLMSLIIWVWVLTK